MVAFNTFRSIAGRSFGTKCYLTRGTANVNAFFIIATIISLGIEKSAVQLKNIKFSAGFLCGLLLWSFPMELLYYSRKM